MGNLDFNYFFQQGWEALPAGWFGNDANAVPLVSSVVGGLADGLTQAYADLQFTANQNFIQTASGMFLDLCAVDYFGFNNLPRRASEEDDAYRARMLSEMLRPRATRAAMSNALIDLTGFTPIIFEPIRDAAGLDSDTYCDAGPGFIGAYDTPFTCFIDVRRPSGPGIPFMSACDVSYCDAGNTNTAANSVGVAGDISALASNVEDSEVYKVVSLTKPAGISAYTRIWNGPIPL
jgi:hypothetical protein